MIWTLWSLSEAHPLSPIVVDVHPAADGARTVLAVAPGPAGEASVDLAGCAVAWRDAAPSLGLVRTEASWTCPGGPTTVEVRGAHELPVVVRVHEGGVTRRFLADGPVALTHTPDAGAWAVEGAAHLVAGADHLAILALLALRTRGLPLLWALTGFTAGHALSLGTAVGLGWSLPMTPVELGISASVVALAVDAARPTPSPGGAWWPLVAVGCLHGLGFADALLSAGEPVRAVDLAAFHLGLELVQGLAVGAFALAVAAAPARARPWVAEAIGAAGVAWFLRGLFG